jgi:hypothetical protein
MIQRRGSEKEPVGSRSTFRPPPFGKIAVKNSSSPGRLVALVGALAALSLSFPLPRLACAADAAPPKASVSFIEPADGATVSSPVKMKFGVTGMALQPAGDIVAGSGHHHVTVDGGPTPADESLPFDDTHLHFGKAQSEGEVKLPPGTHTLTLQFANGAHLSYGPEMSKTITVHVK